MFYRNRQKLVQ